MNHSLRFSILERDNFKCRYCGAEAPNVKLEVDHILSVKKGGGENEENLITACYSCNRGKGKNVTKKTDGRDIEAIKKLYTPRKVSVKIKASQHAWLKKEALKRKMTIEKLFEEILTSK